MKGSLVRSECGLEKKNFENPWSTLYSYRFPSSPFHSKNGNKVEGTSSKLFVSCVVKAEFLCQLIYQSVSQLEFVKCWITIMDVLSQFAQLKKQTNKWNPPEQGNVTVVLAIYKYLNELSVDPTEASLGFSQCESLFEPGSNVKGLSIFIISSLCPSPFLRFSRWAGKSLRVCQ